ncbi:MULTISPECIES: hypothetical protein [Flavobacteriaceae]|uniref:hypothetical protein n=1 Tax=Flavobacteriaceae TaxID=49546 RepID=UPI00214925AB|nr:MULTISPECIES: hypothetical protein [Flavobacteriaceae]MCR1025181.1 hypothetical protein [Cellulophaga baltica]MDO7174229.1 hypothetical protein [Mariniflexile sp. AS56]
MKKTLTLFAILSFLFVNAQSDEGTIYLKDSTEIKGLIKIKTFGGVKFKNTIDSEATNYDHKQITGFDTGGEKYRYINNQEGFPPILLKEKLKGKISLYSNEVYNPGHTIPNGFAGGGTGMTFGGGSATIYHILVKDKLIRVGTKIKKKHLEILKDCTSLIEKIENKDLKKSDVYAIINYYNNSCD